MSRRPYSLCAIERTFWSHRTGLPVSCPKHSAIRSHTEQECNAAVSNAAFSKVDSASNDLDLRILESIYIHDRKPFLNDK